MRCLLNFSGMMYEWTLHCVPTVEITFEFYRVRITYAATEYIIIYYDNRGYELERKASERLDGQTMEEIWNYNYGYS